MKHICFLNSYLLYKHHFLVVVYIKYFISFLMNHFNIFQNIVVQPATPDVAVRPLPQVVEMTGSESPSTINWNSRNPRERHELSRTRLRAIESSLENGQVWVPPSPLHRKTWEEEVNVLFYVLYLLTFVSCLMFEISIPSLNFEPFFFAFLFTNYAVTY